MCKPNKMNGWNKYKYVHRGFGKLRTAYHKNLDLSEAKCLYRCRSAN